MKPDAQSLPSQYSRLYVDNNFPAWDTRPRAAWGAHIRVGLADSRRRLDAPFAAAPRDLMLAEVMSIQQVALRPRGAAAVARVPGVLEARRGVIRDQPN